MEFKTDHGTLHQVIGAAEVWKLGQPLEQLATEFIAMAPWMGVKRVEDLMEFFDACAREPGYLMWVAKGFSGLLLGFCTMSLDEQMVGHGRQVTIHTCYMKSHLPHRALVEKLNEIATEWGREHGAHEVLMASGAGEKWAPHYGFEVESTNWRRSI